MTINNAAVTLDNDGTSTIAKLTLTGTSALTIHDTNPRTTLVMVNGGSSASGTTINLYANGELTSNGVFTNAGTINLGVDGGAGILSGTGSFVNTGTIHAEEGEISATLTIANGGELEIEHGGGPFSVSGALTIASGGELAVYASSGHTTSVTFSGSVTNAGVIELDSGNSGGIDTLNFSGGLTNQAGGVINVLLGDGGDRNLAGTITNLGTIALTTSARLASGTLTNRGAITVASGYVLNVEGSTFVADTGGSLTGLLSIINGSTLSTTSNWTLNAGSTINLLGGSTWSGTGTTSVGGFAYVLDGTISAPVTILSGGTFYKVGSGSLTLSNAFTINSGGVASIWAGSGAVTTISGTTANAGTLRLTSDASYDTSVNLTGTINNTGTLAADLGSGGARTITGGGTVNNTGAVTVESGATLSINAGTTLIAGSGSTFTGSGGTIGLFGNAIFRLASNTTIGTGLTLQLGEYGNGADITQSGGTRLLTNNGTLDLRSGTVTPSILNASGGTILVGHTHGSYGVTLGSLTNALGGVFVLAGDSDGSSAMNFAGNVVNSGTLRLTSTATASATLDASGYTITNNTGGIIDIAVGSGGNRGISGGIVNAGAINVHRDIGFDLHSQSIDNLSGGTFTIDSGTMASLDNGGSGQFKVQSGATLDVSGSGAVLNLSGHDLFDGGGTISGFSNINFGGGAYVVGYAFNGAGYTIASGKKFAIGTGGSLIGSGTFTVADGGTFRIDVNTTIGSGLTVEFGTTGGGGAAWSNTSNATVTIGSAATANLNNGTVGTNLTVASGGAVNVTDSNGLVTLSGAVTNNGFFIISTGNGAPSKIYVTGVLTNSNLLRLTTTGGAGTPILDLTGGRLDNLSGGILDLNAGNGSGGRSIIGQINNAGAINLHADSTFTIGAEDLDNLSGGTVTIDSGKTLTITPGGKGVFKVQSGATLNVTGAMNLGGHDLYDYGATINNFNNIVFSGGAYVVGYAFNAAGYTVVAGKALGLANGGSFTGSGTLTVADNAALRTAGNGTVDTGITVSFGTVGGSGATWTATGGSVATTIAGTLRLWSGEVSSNLIVASGGVIQVSDAYQPTLSGTTTIASGGTLLVKDIGNQGTATYLTVTGTLINTGTILVTIGGAGAYENETLDVTGGTASNMSGGVLQFDTTSGSTGVRTLLGSFNNGSGGTIAVNYHATFNSGTINNAGAISVASGYTLTAGASSIIDQVAYTGAYTGTGTIFFADSSAFTLHANATIGAGLKVLLGTDSGAGSTWTDAGSNTLTVAGSVTITRGTIAPSVTIVNGGELVASESDNGAIISGAVTVQSGGILRVKEVSNNAHWSNLQLTNTVDNYGLVNVTIGGASAFGNVYLDFTGGQLVNHSGGVLLIDTTSGSTGGRNIAGNINNLAGGTITASYDTTYDTNTIQNAGTLELVGATLFTVNTGIFANTGAAAAYTGSGTLYIKDGAIFRSDANTTLGAGFTLRLGADGGGSGATWSVNNSSIVTIQGKVGLHTATVHPNMTVASGGLLNVSETGAGAYIYGNVTVQTGGTFRVKEVSNNVSNSYVNIQGTLNNSGLVWLAIGGAGAYGDVYLDMTGGVFNNLSGGTFLVDTEAGSTGTRTFVGQFNNAGTATISYNTTFTPGSSNIGNTNGSTFTIDSGATLTITAGGTGAFKVGSGATLTVTGILNTNGHDVYHVGTIVGKANINLGAGYFVYVTPKNLSGGTIGATARIAFGAGSGLTGTGTVTFDNYSNIRFDAGVGTAATLNVQIGQYGGSGATIIGTGTMVLNGGADLRSGYIGANVTNANGSTILALASNNAVTFANTVSNQAGGVIQIQGVYGTGASEVNFTSMLNNAGTIVLTSSGGGTGADATLDAQGYTINNLAAGVININAGSGGMRSIYGGLSNNGTVNLNADTHFSIGAINSANFSGGAFNVLAGETMLAADGSATFSNSGALNIASGATLALGSGITLNHFATGNFTGAGTLALGSGSSLNIGANSVSMAPYVVFGAYGGAASIVGSATLTIAKGMDLRAGTIAPSVVNNSGSTIAATASNDAVTFGGGFTNLAGGILRIEGVYANAASEVNFGNTLTNGGTIQLTSSGGGGGATATLDASGHIITNQAGGLISSAVGDGGSRAINGGINNSGTITVDAYTTFTVANNAIDILSGGTFTVSSGAIAVIAPGGSGQFRLESGGTLTVASGAGLYLYSHDFYDAGGTITGMANIVFSGGIYVIGYADNVAGRTIQNFQTTGYGAGASLVGTGTVTVEGSVRFDVAVNMAPTLNAVLGSISPSYTAVLYGPGSVTNNGTVTVNQANIITTVNNAGAIDIASGRTLMISSAGTLAHQSGGTYTGSGTGTLVLASGGAFSLGANNATLPFLVQLGYANQPASITGSGTLTLTGGADLRAGTVSPAVVNASGSTMLALNTVDQVTFSNTVTNQSGATLQIEGITNSGLAAEVNFTNTLNNAGTIVLTTSGGGGGGGATLDATGGTINNNSGGVFNLNSGGGYARTVIGAFNNNSGGALNVNINTTYQGGTLTNQGTIFVAASTTLTIANGATLIQGASGTGTYTGTGTLMLPSGSIFTLNAAASLAPKLQIGSGGAATVNGSGTLTFNGGVDLVQGTISVPVVNASGSTMLGFNTANVVTFSNTVTNQSGATLQIDGFTNGGATAEVNFTSTLDNAGTIILTTSGGGGGGGATLDATGGTINNNSGGVFNVNAGAGYARTVNGAFNNANIVNVNAGATFNIANSNWNNLSGAQLNVTAGASSIGGTGTSKLNNASTISISSGASLAITGTTTLTQQTGGTYTGSGTLILGAGAAFDVAVNASLAPKLQIGSGGAATISGSGTVTLNGGADLRAGTVSPAVVNASGSTMLALNTVDQVTFSNTVTNQSGATLQIEGITNSGLAAEVNFTNTLNNAGTIVLTTSGGGGGGGATLDATGGTINNNSGGVFNLNSGGGYARTVIGAFNNNSGGALNVNINTTYQGGTLTNQGTIFVAASTTLTIANGATLIQGASGTGTYTGTGTLMLPSGSIFTLNAAASLAPKLQIGSGGAATVNGSGTLTFNGGVDLVQGTISVPVVNASGSTMLGFNTANVVTFSNTVTNQSGATLQIDGFTNGGATAEVNFTSTLDNAGTIILTTSGGGGGGGATLDATGGTINNNSGGVFNVNAGAGYARAIYGEFNNFGAVNVNTSATFNTGTHNLSNESGGTFTIASGATLNFLTTGGIVRNHNGATFTVASGGTLVMNGHDFQNDASGTVALNGDIYMGDGPGNSALGGGTFTQGGTISGSGTLHLEGGTASGSTSGWTVNPGNSPGMLTIDGSLHFNTAATLNIELAGTGQGQFDVLKVDGNFHFGGDLNTIGYHGYAPQAGNTFEVLHYGSASGMFDEASGLDAFPGLALQPIFGPNTMTLVTRTVTVSGSTGDDMLTGASGNDVIVGGVGNDTLIGGAGDDLLLGGEGTNTLIGGAGNDTLIGGHGTDTVDYSAETAPVQIDLSKGTESDANGHDTLISVENVVGTSFADTIVGNQKDNVIVGGGGADTLTGGAGNNTFVLRGLSEGGDTITDFKTGQDTLCITDPRLANILGTLTDGQTFSTIAGKFDGVNAGTNACFSNGTAAFVYSESDHTLYFDDNGAEEGYTVVAHLQPNAHLAATDVRITDHALA